MICDDADKILGLTVGADDYITKPFNPMEVTARRKKSHIFLENTAIYRMLIEKSIAMKHLGES